jgi:hypothetical protein
VPSPRRIRDEVCQHLQQQAAIRLDHRGARARHDLESDVRPRDAFQLVPSVAHELICIEHLGDDPAAPRVREQLTGELRHAVGGRFDPPHRFFHGDLKRLVLACRTRLGEHARQLVVEVMSNTARDEPERFESLLGVEIGLTRLGRAQIALDREQDQCGPRPLRTQRG